MLDEMERSIHDSLCVVKRVMESKSVVPGGGAVEAALSIYLENYATSLVRTSVLDTLLLFLVQFLMIVVKLNISEFEGTAGDR